MRFFLLAFLLSVNFMCLYAGNFTPGNIVVVRVGVGVGTLNNQSTAVFLDEYTPAGVYVQSLAAPTSGSGSNHALTLSGTATTEGALSLSTNGQYLTFCGYDTSTGYAGVASGITNRTIARVSSNGTFNTSTGFVSGSAYVLGNMRSAVSVDGNEFWTSGSGGSTGGIWYLPFGSFSSNAVQTSTTLTSVRVVNIAGGQLYGSTNSTPTGIYTDSTGLPTTAGQTENMLPGLPTLDTVRSPYAFMFLDESSAVPGVDVLYVADDDTAASYGGLYKYSLVGGSWVSNGRVANTNFLRGITGYHTCSGSKLFLSSVGGIWSFFDSTGYNQNIRGSFTTLVTASPNTVIRGIAFAPNTVFPTSPVASIASSSNVSCFGQANGAINISVTGGTAPLSYLWNGNITTQNRTSLSPGVYTVTVTDAYGCTSTVNDTISQPAALTAVVSSHSNISCHGANNGVINISASGGTQRYTYLWTGGDTVADRSGLAAGAYTVTVTDHNGCTASISETLTQPNVLAVTIDSITNLPCTGGSTGAVKISVAGGTGAYTFHWSNSATTQNISGLTAGTYRVLVTDSAGCNTTDSAIVSQSGSLRLSDTVRAVTCYGQANGSISVAVSGGTPGYSYRWSGSSDTTSRIVSLTAGSYTLTVSDHAGCVDVLPISVGQPNPITISDSITNLPCTGGSTGAVKISVTGGTGTYTFHWSNNATTQDINGLTANTYIVLVTDSAGCGKSDTAIVTQASGLRLSDSVTAVTCYGLADGMISVSVSGGTPAYSYRWSTNDSTAVISNLSVGSYTVTVSDHSGCVSTTQVSITQPDSLSLTLTPVDVTTHGGSDGSISLSVSGGTGTNYSYLWSNTATTQNISGLTANSYCVTVTDQHSCRDSSCVAITQPTGINELAWASDLRVYASASYINVILNADQEMNMTVELYDLTGQLVYRSASVYGSKLDMQIPDAGIASGCYIVRVSTDQGSTNRKVVVLK